MWSGGLGYNTGRRNIYSHLTHQKMDEDWLGKIDLSKRYSETLIRPKQMMNIKTILPTGPSCSLSSGGSLAVIKEIDGIIGYGNLQASGNPARQTLRAKATVLGNAMPNTPITFYDKTASKTLGTVQTDSNGIASMDVTTDQPCQKVIVACLGPQYFPFSEALPSTSIAQLTVWLLKWHTENVTDVWERFQGRSIGEAMSFGFWGYPQWNAGIAGGCDFFELIPILGNQSIEYDIGVSAWCATTNPSPTAAECCAAPAWWDVTVSASNQPGGALQQVGDVERINIDYHVICQINANSINVSKSKISDRCGSQD